MHVRLTRKLAQALDGLDLSGLKVGDLIELSQPMASMLVAEGWAETVSPHPSIAE